MKYQHADPAPAENVTGQFRQQMRCLVAIVMISYAAATRTLLPDYLAARHPFLTFYPFLFIAGLYGGFATGLFATAIAVMAAVWWVEPPAHAGTFDFYSLIVFVLFCATVSFIGEMNIRKRSRSTHVAAVDQWLPLGWRERRLEFSEAHKKLRILLVDDHPAVRNGLATLLNGTPDLEVAGEAPDGESAIDLAQKVLPDVILMDICLPGIDGVQATRKIRRELPATRVIGLSMLDGSDQKIRAMHDAGALYYVDKSRPAETIISTIRACA